MPIQYEAGLRVGSGTAEEALADALRAIKFALAIDDHWNMREFLQGWSEGDVSEWPEFAAGSSKPDLD